jgi:hypothetical protein
LAVLMVPVIGTTPGSVSVRRRACCGWPPLSRPARIARHGAKSQALAGPTWIRQLLDEIENGHPRRAAAWVQMAIHAADLHICWTTTPDRPSAVPQRPPGNRRADSSARSSIDETPFPEA